VSNDDSAPVPATEPEADVDVKASPPAKSELVDEPPSLEVMPETIVPPVAAKDETNKSG
jgi:hypothetical protein